MVALIGVGPFVGEHIAKEFAKKEYSVALLSRSVDTLERLSKNPGNGSKAFYCDVKKPKVISSALKELRSHYDVEEPDVVIYNVRDWHFGRFYETDPSVFKDCWELATFGLFHIFKEVAPGMAKRGYGSIGITGATANWRGRPETVAFAPPKAAQRSLAQSMAREFGPKGVHVYLIVVDGVISESGGTHVSPSAIGSTHLYLAEQPNGAWTFELNLTSGPGHNKLVTL